MAFIPSPYQQAIFDFVSDGTGNAVVIAVAGAGKSTTILRALDLIPTDAKVNFLAFNQKIAKELSGKVPPHVRASTFHSVGMGAWRRARPAVTVNEYKCSEILDRMMDAKKASVPGWDPGELIAARGQLLKLVSLAKNGGVHSLLRDEHDVWLDMIDHHGMQFDMDEAVAINTARAILRRSNEMALDRNSVIDFDDMLYMPILSNCSFFRLDWLFVDEAQDTNALQLAMLRRMLKPSGRLVAVGDPRQAIYGFRGAGHDSIDRIKDAFMAIELPLTVSYRCARAVVAKAKTLVPYIESAPSAPDGAVFNNTDAKKVKFDGNDAVICRNVAPLIEFAYRLVAEKVSCRVLGREIGKGLIALIDKMKAQDIDSLVDALDAWCQREVAKFMAKNREQQAQAVQDRADCVHALIAGLPEDLRTVAGLRGMVDQLFSDEAVAGAVTLCTAHKSKGLEWDRVFVLRPDLMPSKAARKDWQLAQEENLQYVTWTRAKIELHFLKVVS